MTDAKKFTDFPVATPNQVFGSNTWFLSSDNQPSANGFGNNYRVPPSVILIAALPVLTPLSANVSMDASLNGGVCYSNNANATVSFANTLPDGFIQRIAILDSNSTITISTTGLTNIGVVSASQISKILTAVKIGATLIVY